jgi:excisionase family DNA binding protein
MDVKILETGEIISFDYYCAGDVIGNAGATSDGQFTWDNENEIWVADQDTITWWLEYFCGQEQTEAEISSLADEINLPLDQVKHEFETRYLRVDMEDGRREAVRVLAEIREQYKPYLSTTEAAEALGVARITIIKWAKSGKIHGAQKIGRDWIIPRQSLDGLECSPSRWDS